VGDLGLAQSVPEREMDDRDLLGRKGAQRGMDAMVVAAQVFQLVGRGHGRWHQVGGRGVQRAAGPDAGAQPIDGAAAGDGHHPGDGAASMRIELPRALPQLQEGLLHDLLGVPPIPKNARRDGHRAPDVAVEQPANGLDLPVGHAGQENLIFVVRALSIQRRGRRRDGAGEHSSHAQNMRTRPRFATSISRHPPVTPATRTRPLALLVIPSRSGADPRDHGAVAARLRFRWHGPCRIVKEASP
jgi:hypothetical protein